MKLGYIILYVENVTETIAFYERAFSFTRRMITDEGEYGEIEIGAIRLAFAANHFVKTLTNIAFTEAGADKPASPLEIAFVTDDVEAAFAKAVIAGASEIKKPALKPWGQLVGYLRDNNGFIIEICSPSP